MNKALIIKILQALIIMLLASMTCTVGYNYAYMECAIAHQGASAPVYIAFLAGVPFVILIAVCLIIIKVIKEKK